MVISELLYIYFWLDLFVLFWKWGAYMLVGFYCWFWFFMCSCKLVCDLLICQNLNPGIFCYCCFSTSDRSIMCSGACNCRADWIPAESMEVCFLLNYWTVLWWYLFSCVWSKFYLVLEKANRALRQATLGTLNSLIVAYGDKIGPSAYEVIIVELSTLIRFYSYFTYYFGSVFRSWAWLLSTLLLSKPHFFVSDSDLHMTALALELCCTLMADKRSSRNVDSAVRNRVLPQALTLIKSSLLQGQALLVSPFHFNEMRLHLLSGPFMCYEPSLLEITGFAKIFCWLGVFGKY